MTAIRTAAVLALVSMTGCSLFLTHGPSSGPVSQQTPPDCTTSMMYPTLDGVVAVVATLLVVSSISSKNTAAQKPDDGAVASGFIIAGTAGVSGLIGHSRVSKCRRATETYTAKYYGQQPAYPYAQGYGYQPYPAAPAAPAYPQPYPTTTQPYPPQQYPAPQQYPTAPPQQYPTAPPQPYPTQQPYPAQPYQPPTASRPPIPANPAVTPAKPPVVVRPTAPPAKPPVAAKPPAKPAKPDTALGTEGDVCTAQIDCSAGLSCTGNVCLKK